MVQITSDAEKIQVELGKTSTPGVRRQRNSIIKRIERAVGKATPGKGTARQINQTISFLADPRDMALVIKWGFYLLLFSLLIYGILILLTTIGAILANAVSIGPDISPDSLLYEAKWWALSFIGLSLFLIVIPLVYKLAKFLINVILNFDKYHQQVQAWLFGSDYVGEGRRFRF